LLEYFSSILRVVFYFNFNIIFSVFVVATCPLNNVVRHLARVAFVIYYKVLFYKLSVVANKIGVASAFVKLLRKARWQRGSFAGIGCSATSF